MSASLKNYTNRSSAGLANKTRVVRGLLTELLQGKWESADRLTEAEACQLFKVSRTPVREALFELQGLGLLEIRRNCGAVMLPFGPQEFANLFAVRTLLEVEAARLAAKQGDKAKARALISEYEEVLESKEEMNFWEHDQEVHHYIASSSGNMSLAAEISRYKNLIKSMREILETTPRELKPETIGEHIEILEHIENRDAEEAGIAMRKHLDQSVDSAVASMESFRLATV